MGNDLFTSFDVAMRAPLTEGISSAISRSLSAVSPELATLLTLFVVLQGMMIMFRAYDVMTGAKAVAKAGIVAALLTASMFSSYIQTPFTTTIPNWISSMVGGAPLNGSQFDAIYSAIEHFGAGVLQQASGFSGIAVRLEVAILAWGCALFLGVGYIVWLITIGFINLVVCLGPFVLLAKLFRYTEGIFDRWIGKIVGLLMLYLLITILEQVVLSGEMYFVRQTQANPGTGVDEQVAAMISMAAFFALCAAMLVFVPAVASYVGGGAHTGLTNLLTPMFRRVVR